MHTALLCQMRVSITLPRVQVPLTPEKTYEYVYIYIYIYKFQVYVYLYVPVTLYIICMSPLLALIKKALLLCLYKSLWGGYSQ